ncbi:O-acetylhomoserine aminocarboxypropyltransferase/cysteine synthase [candidate division WOR-3 bacterium]|uniref:O-acetylhomoserine aminocarboxypropyltransferase/cysteine synthase n=1 Tax=candidate division WOR-3 bacterium TaxID=2052148 RepID=A0A937XCN0_UNCW3|nr:O-acetylhomoserine aminocarboxypropyltransferase/cysteine synthase [candidate division WOR-3 bacterium]
MAHSTPPSPSEGVQKYIDRANQALEVRKQDIARAKKRRFDTIAVHGLYTATEAIEKNQGAIIEPVFASSGQAYRDSDEMEAAQAGQIPTWAYIRIHNPTLGYLEDTLALLEAYGTEVDAGCVVYSSGMAAIENLTDTLLVKQGSDPINFVAQCQIYGGTFQQFNVRKMQERGIEVRWILDPNNLDEWRSKIDRNTRFLYGELPSNPGLVFFDLKKTVDLAHEHGLPYIADSTIATPALLRPLAYGADIVVHSVTKTMSASGTGTAGAIIARKSIPSNVDNDRMKADLCTYLREYPHRDQGGCLHPYQALSSINDLRTLRTRVDVWSQSALKVARFLQKQPGVTNVNYLGLEDHPLHPLASKYLWLADSEYDDRYGKKVNRYGHLLSFRVKAGPQAARKVFDRLQLIMRVTDLGRVKSIATIPSISTHLQQGEESRKMAHIPPDLIRLSVGAEHPDDIVADLEQALSGAK